MAVVMAVAMAVAVAMARPSCPGAALLPSPLPGRASQAEAQNKSGPGRCARNAPTRDLPRCRCPALPWRGPGEGRGTARTAGDRLRHTPSVAAH